MRLFLLPVVSLIAGLAGCAAPVSREAPIYLQGSLKDEAPPRVEKAASVAPKPVAKAEAPKLKRISTSPMPKTAERSVAAAPAPVPAPPATKPPAPGES